GTNVWSVGPFAAPNVVLMKPGSSSGAAIPRSITTGALVDVGVILRSSGAWVLARTPGEPWRIVYIADSNNATPVWARMIVPAALCGFSWDDVAVLSAPAPWTSDNGPATAVLSSPAAGATCAHEANCVITCNRTFAAGETADLMFRWTDDNNCWIVRMAQTAGTIQLIEKVGGVETQRATATPVIPTGSPQFVTVAANGQGSTVWFNDAQRADYAAAASNQTATTAKTTLAATSLVTWPYFLSGAPLAALNYAYPFGSPALTTVYTDGTLAADTTTYNPA